MPTKLITMLTMSGLAVLALSGCQVLPNGIFGTKPTDSTKPVIEQVSYQDNAGKPITFKQAVNGNFVVSSVKSTEYKPAKDAKVKAEVVTVKPKDDFGWAKIIGIVLIIAGVGCFGVSVAKELVGGLNAIVGLFAIGWKASVAIIVAGAALYYMVAVIAGLAIFLAAFLAYRYIKMDLKDNGKLDGSKAEEWVNEAKAQVKAVENKVEQSVEPAAKVTTVNDSAKSATTDASSTTTVS